VPKFYLGNMHIIFTIIFLLIGINFVISATDDWEFVESDESGDFRYLTHYKKKNSITGAPYVLYIMFNPSTGGVGGGEPDSTIKKLMAFTEASSDVMGWSTLKAFKIINLFAFRNKSPEELLKKLDEKSNSKSNSVAFGIVQGHVFKNVGSGRKRQRIEQKYDEDSDYWNTLARGAKFICAAWGDLPKPTTKDGYRNIPAKGIVPKWQNTWIPMITARKIKVATWLNKNYPGKAGYLKESSKGNPRHPLFLSRRNDKFTLARLNQNISN